MDPQLPIEVYGEEKEEGRAVRDRNAASSVSHPNAGFTATVHLTAVIYAAAYEGVLQRYGEQDLFVCCL